MSDELFELLGEPRPIPRGYNPSPALLSELKQLEEMEAEETTDAEVTE